ncbi:lethal(2) giant larvae protein homolog SRO77-like [Prunus yedoensis var. nudiflora]|uniref:Lethal(2) giant larvae protein homolog SRO77-like n=1 Tax=Prunus yedoensis var. nudiflora TaxID=2094558 RepID=A0A314ZKQ4_PRUYE|nr:lethal(2) giant larvae protein homolog SRO77-like [Prunus yedoensis var. nudiflora]
MFAKLFNKSSPQEASHPQARVRQASRFTMGYHPLHPFSHLIAHKACWQLAHCEDGRIKVLGGDNIQELLTSPKPKPLPFKNLEVSKFRMFPGSHKSLDLCIV